MSPLRLSVVLSAALILPAAVAPASADVVVEVLNLHKVEGTVPPGEDIRIVMSLAAGTEGVFKITLTGSRVPVSFTTGAIRVLDPAGADVAAEDLEFGPQKIKKGKSTLKMTRLLARTTGDYTLVLATNAPDTTFARGKFKVKRARTVKFTGDETSDDVPLPLMNGDRLVVTVKRVDGATPDIAAFVLPGGARPRPGQKLKKKGAKSILLTAVGEGAYAIGIGYQDGGVAGAFKGKIKITTVKGIGLRIFRLANSPGIPLSVRADDRTLNVGDVGDTGVGIDSDVTGRLVVTSIRSGVLRARRFAIDLTPLNGEAPQPVPMLDSAVDLTPGEILGGHRLLFADGHHFVTFHDTTGTSLGIAKFNRALNRVLFDGTLAGRMDPGVSTFEPFMVLHGDGETISVGGFLPPTGHSVLLVDTNTLSDQGMATIGAPGSGLDHGNGAAAAWNPVTDRFVFVAPDTVVPGVASDLHQQFYSSGWGPLGQDNLIVADAAQVETMSTALSVDGATGVSILHYVVTRNAATGTGEVHRRLFDETGLEIPGSFTVLSDPATGRPLTGLNRPVSFIEGNFLFVAYESTDESVPAPVTRPVVKRYPLLR